MKILILSPHYFPNINPRAHRWTNLAEYWAAQGHEVYIICSKNKDYPEEEELNKVRVYRTGFNSPKEILYYFLNNEVKRGETGQKKQNAGRKGALMQWVNDKILRSIYFPDDAFIWYRPAKKLMHKLLKKKEFDLLISSSVPFTTHLVALNAKKNYPDLKWIADTGDPFAFQPLHPMNNYFLYGKLNKRLEKKVVRVADFVTLTNEGAKKLYDSIFPLQVDKFVVLPPLCRHKKTDATSVIIKEDRKELKVGYFGSFFKKIREPRPILNYWSNLLAKYPTSYEFLELHFYGNIFENFLVDFDAFPKLKKHFWFHGLVTSERAILEMQNMDLLFNVGNFTDFQLASKSVDYLISRKPIINFVSIDNDTFSKFFEGYDFIEDFNVTKVNSNIDRLHNFINKYSNKVEKEKLDSFVSQKEVEFQIEIIAKNYLALIKNL